MSLALTKLAFGGGVFLFGFSIVLFCLIVLLYYIKFQSLFFTSSKKKEKTVELNSKKKIENATVPTATSNDGELIAVISAAVAMALGTAPGNLVIKSYRRIGANTPAWRQAGRRDSVFNKF